MSHLLCDDCLQSVAESATESEFIENVEQLYNSNVWKKNVQLQRYIERQWLDDGRYKVCTCKKAELFSDVVQL